MIIALIGESCTGKSAIANELSKRTAAKVYTGKDYLKLAKNEPEAKKLFADLLRDHEGTEDIIVYVISEKEHLTFLPGKTFRVLVTADLDTIKARFAKRMNGNLPPAVAAMLEAKHGLFDDVKHDLKIDNTGETVTEIVDEIRRTFP